MIFDKKTAAAVRKFEKDNPKLAKDMYEAGKRAARKFKAEAFSCNRGHSWTRIHAQVASAESNIIRWCRNCGTIVGDVQRGSKILREELFTARVPRSASKLIPGARQRPGV